MKFYEFPRIFWVWALNFVRVSLSFIKFLRIFLSFLIFSISHPSRALELGGWEQRFSIETQQTPGNSRIFEKNPRNPLSGYRISFKFLRFS